LILAAVYFKLSRRVKLNEPPLVYYRFPIIGHTWSFLMDCEKLILESREKYGETFSIYAFGQIMTIAGNEATYEILKNDQEFSFFEAVKKKIPLHIIFNNVDHGKNIKIIREYAIGKLRNLLGRLQKEVIKAIDLYIGECIEPKVIHDPDKTLANIIVIPVANFVVGELDGLQCYLDDPEINPDNDPNNVNYNFIVDAICIFIFVAIGSTIKHATLVLYDLIKRKQYWHELYQEALEINKQCNGKELTYDDIHNMVKLDGFVKESLRLATNDHIVGLAHLCISKSYYTFANGYQIPNGRMVLLNYIDSHNDEELQGQNPTEFHAYRHLERNSPATKIGRNNKAIQLWAKLVVSNKIFLMQVIIKEKYPLNDVFNADKIV
ncbi:3717_t:CDS:10, partial [Dentiscutata heterogama]